MPDPNSAAAVLARLTNRLTFIAGRLLTLRKEMAAVQARIKRLEPLAEEMGHKGASTKQLENLRTAQWELRQLVEEEASLLAEQTRLMDESPATDRAPELGNPEDRRKHEQSSKEFRDKVRNAGRWAWRILRSLFGTTTGLILLGTILVLGGAFYFGMPDDGAPADSLGAGPASTGPHGDKPLSGEVGMKTPGLPDAPAKPAPGGPRSQYIHVASGMGPEESFPEIPLKQTSGGIVSAEKQRAHAAWVEMIKQQMPVMPDVTDVWENRMAFFGVPPVVKAELQQQGQNVTGWMWILKERRGSTLSTVKLPVTKGQASGAPGSLSVNFELAGGAVRGVLSQKNKGARLEGELNGAKVSLSGKRSADAQAALEKENPSPLAPRKK